MIEIITFLVGKPDYDKEYTITYEKGVCYAQILNKNGFLRTKRIDEKDFDNKIKPFEEFGIYKWRKDYYVEPKDFLDNDICWILQYKELGKRYRHIGGYGKFPDGWEKLLKAVNNVFPSFKYKDYVKTKGVN